MENNANLSDGARQADTVSSEHAETMFSADQAETNMVKLVDGKLTPIGDTETDVSDDMPRIRLGSDEERALVGDDKKKYETSDAALRAGNVIDMSVMPNDPIAVADITGNPDAGSTVNTGLPTEDAPNRDGGPDRTEAGGDVTSTSSFGSWAVPTGDMIPPTPGTPDPLQPVPGIPETPPYNPVPGPEIPDLPGQPSPDRPEITEPSQPDRSHEVNSNFITFTSGAPGESTPGESTLGESTPGESTPGESTPGESTPGESTLGESTPGASSADELIPGAAMPGNQYQGLAAGPDDQGMEDGPDTGDSAHPYDVNAKDADEYQPGERPEERKEAQSLPREMMDESSIQGQDMISGPDRSDQKSTDGLDRTYNDPQAARDLAS